MISDEHKKRIESMAGGIMRAMLPAVDASANEQECVETVVAGFAAVATVMLGKCGVDMESREGKELVVSMSSAAFSAAQGAYRKFAERSKWN